MPDWAIHCGDSIRVSGEGGTRMDDDRFRARIWEHVASAGADGIPEALIRKADSEMKAAGYKCLTQAFPQYGHRTFLISLYERRPPTIREAGDAMAEVLDRHIAGAEVARSYAVKLAWDWREAVEREVLEANTDALKGAGEQQI